MVTIRQFDNVGHSPAWPFIPVALQELVESGVGEHPQVGPVYNDPALIAFDHNLNMLGFLIYRYNDVRSGWFIMLSWVRQSHRREGIHTKLFQTLVERAYLRGDILNIECGTHVDNTAAQRAFEKQGRIAKGIIYSFPIREWAMGNDPLEIKK